MPNDDLEWLQNFYGVMSAKTHYFKIKIETIDNPGWIIDFEIEETLFEKLSKGKSYQMEIDENNWIRLKIENNEIRGACGPKNLRELLAIVKSWCAE